VLALFVSWETAWFPVKMFPSTKWGLPSCLEWLHMDNHHWWGWFRNLVMLKWLSCFVAFTIGISLFWWGKWMNIVDCFILHLRVSTSKKWIWVSLKRLYPQDDIYLR
jgi:hypothetical protein